MAKQVTIGGVKYDIEALSAMKDILEGARNMQLSVEEVVKMINANQRLAKSYVDINKSLEQAGKLYSKQRHNIDDILKFNKEIFKHTKADEATRKNINDLTNKNLHFLDDTLDFTNKIVRGEMDSLKIKKELSKLELSSAKVFQEQEKAQKSLKTGYVELQKLLTSGSIVGSGLIDETLTKQLEISGAKYQNLLEELTNATSEKQEKSIRTKLDKESQVSANIIKEILEKSNGDKDVAELINNILESTNVISSLTLQEDGIKKITEQFEKYYNITRQTEKSIAGIDRVLKSLQHTPLSSIIDFRAMSDAMSQKMKAGQGTTTALTSSLIENSSLVKMGLVGGSVALLKEIVELMAKADSRATDLAKSFNVSKNEIGGVYDRLESFNNELGINIDDLIKSQIKFNDEFGYSVNLSEEFLKSIVRNNKLIGLSQQANNELISNALYNNQEISKVENDIIGNIVLQSKGLANVKGVLEKVLHSSSEIKANFKGNYGEIAKAVTKAQELGTTLEKIDSISESLLDFESSLNAELSAELITGKSINLEKARYASLMGDTATLMKEITSQVGSFDEFTNMNVLQQQSYAQALGYTRKEMIDMLYQQKINATLIKVGNNKFTEDQRSFLSHSEEFKSKYSKIMNDGLLSQEEKIRQLGELGQQNLSQLSAQQKFEETLNKIKEKIAEIFGDGAILDKLADSFVSYANFFGVISDKDEKEYLAKNIASRKLPNVNKDSDEYKSLIQEISKYGIEQLKNLSELESIKGNKGEKSVEYKAKLSMNKEIDPLQRGIYQYPTGKVPTSDFEMFSKKIDELIEVTKRKNTTVQIDSLPIKQAFNKTNHNQ
jgi:hypothetical protein